MGKVDGCPHNVEEEDLLRAQVYGLLGRLLARAPDREILDLVAGIDGDDSEFGTALSALAETARSAAPDTVLDEYNALFIGVTRGELVPYASYYLTGFLHEKPLAELHADMARLGLTRSDDVSEPEDHIAALCEMMHGFATGVFGTPLPLSEQRRFFDAHIASWAAKFFEDLEAADAAAFYAPVGRVGRLFMAIEAEAFEMAA